MLERVLNQLEAVASWCRRLASTWAGAVLMLFDSVAVASIGVLTLPVLRGRHERRCWSPGAMFELGVGGLLVVRGFLEKEVQPVVSR